MWKFIPIIIAVIIISLLMVFLVKKNKEEKLTNFAKIQKILIIVFFSLSFASIVHPDAYIMSGKEDVILAKTDSLQNILRWFSYMSVVVLPIAVFHPSAKTFRNIAVYFCLPVSVLCLVSISTFVPYWTDPTGRGLNGVNFISDSFKAFLLNATFRVIWYSLIQTISIFVSVSLLLIDKHKINFNNKIEVVRTLIIFACLLVLLIPIYIPQMMFGFSSFSLKQFNLVHIAWILFVALQTVGLYFIFKNKDMESKYLLCLVLALITLFQYNLMFSLTISIKRLPLQLCNLASYLMCISLITKNKHIFNFNLIVNVVGASLAILLPDVDNVGIFNVWNVHFITEHTQIVSVPLLALSLNVFPRMNKGALKDYFVGFTGYFIFCIVVGTILNGMVTKTGNNAFEVNYLFMFDMEKAVDTLPFIEPLTKVEINFSYFTLYPAVQLVIYLFYNALCVGLYFFIRFIYYVKDKKTNSLEVSYALNS